MFTMRFEGGEELARNLNALSTAVSYKVLIEGLKEAAEPMRARMSQLAPREPGQPDLADHIGISTSSRIGNIEGDYAPREAGQASVAIGPTKHFFYGLFLEFGTSRQGAQPFARPAFDSDAPKALGIMGRVFWTALAARGVIRLQTSTGPVSGGPGGGLL